MVQLAGRTAFYDEPVDGEALSNLLISCIWQTINLLIIHLIITKWGLIFVESEILREGNNQVLDDLDEAVIVLNEQSLL